MDSLNAVLREEAIGLGLCEKWTREWDHSLNDYEFCERFKRGQDFCIEHDWPKADFIRKFFDGETLGRMGVFLDRTLGGVLPNGTYVCMGDCEGELEFGRWGAAVVYLRGNARVRIRAGAFSRVSVRLYDGAEAEIVDEEGARVRLIDKR